MVTEKGKEIAILKALGASDGAILRTFMIEGIIIGGIGTVFGVVTGLAVCTGLGVVRPTPRSRGLLHRPLARSRERLGFPRCRCRALVICTLATIYPAYMASKLRPVDGLRYE